MTPACPRCARPLASPQARCLYCGAALPAELVAAAAAARAALEAEWAREGGRAMAPAAAAEPLEPVPPGAAASAPPAVTADVPRRLLLLDPAAADPAALQRALGLSAF